jgi:transposase-like protein
MSFKAIRLKAQKSSVRGMFNARNREEGERQLDQFISSYQAKAPKLAGWGANPIP